MSAALQSAWSALASFLRGFTGITRTDRCHDLPHDVRSALAEDAARRGRCC